jgi:hypothetical protein
MYTALQSFEEYKRGTKLMHSKHHHRQQPLLLAQPLTVSPQVGIERRDRNPRKLPTFPPPQITTPVGLYPFGSPIPLLALPLKTSIASLVKMGLLCRLTCIFLVGAKWSGHKGANSGGQKQARRRETCIRENRLYCLSGGGRKLVVDRTSRVTGDCQARFWVRLGVKLSGTTRRRKTMIVPTATPSEDFPISTEHRDFTPIEWQRSTKNPPFVIN